MVQRRHQDLYPSQFLNLTEAEVAIDEFADLTLNLALQGYSNYYFWPPVIISTYKPLCCKVDDRFSQKLAHVIIISTHLSKGERVVNSRFWKEKIT